MPKTTMPAALLDRARKAGIAAANKEKNRIKQRALFESAFDQAYGKRLLEIEEEVREETGFTGFLRV